MRRLTWVLSCTLLLVACGGGTATEERTTTAEETSASPSPESELSGEVLVFAAASLTDAFEEMSGAFSEANPDVTLTFNFAASSALAQQITQGAPADVFASANYTQMDVVEDAGLLDGEAEPFIGNALQIAVAPGNPLGITGVADLARAEVTLVLAAPEVPAGEYAQQVFAEQGITVTPSSLEVDVRAVLARVALGEADAGVVYASDVVAAGGEVDGVEIPEDQNVPADYPIATLSGAPNPEAGAAFVEYVRSDEGQAILQRYGFVEPVD